MMVAFNKPVSQEQLKEVLERHKLVVKRIYGGEARGLDEEIASGIAVRQRDSLGLSQGALAAQIELNRYRDRDFGSRA